MTIDSLIQSIIDELRHVPGVQAVVLGGSRARGTHTPSSDIDLGIYYDPHSPLDLAALAQAAARLDDERRADLLTPIGGWGPWINGGGWLKIQSVPVDFLYRDLTQVEAVIDACLAGKVEVFYQAGHPLGFVSSMYLAEIAVCQPLWDSAGRVAGLKSRVIPYPAALQQALIQKFAWEVDFSIGIAQKSIARADVAYAAGCCFRGVMCLLQVLFALNHAHWLNEKGAVAMAEQFALKPDQFQSRVNEIFGLLQAQPQSIEQAVSLLQALNAELHDLLRVTV
jgi:predicted nucleotidyltransferase